MTNTYRKSHGRIYRLDNAANLYPAIRNTKRPNVFRVSADLTQPIDPNILQNALDITLQRLPGFSVKLRSGLFWYHFVHSDDRILIQKDVANPCTHMSVKSTGGFLIRVRYHQNRIALETFHAITDGSGAMVFLKTLIAQYLKYFGMKIPPTNGVLDCGDAPDNEEFSDQFGQFAKGRPLRKTHKSRAFHVRGTLLPPGEIQIITGTIPINALKQSAKLFNATITEYLTAVYLKTLFDQQKLQSVRLQLPVKVQVPINLRNFVDTKTLRNFSAFVTPSLDPAYGDYSFAEIVKMVHHFLKYESTKKHLQSQVAANLRYANNAAVRMLPLGLKNNIIFLGYKLMGPAYFSSTISNLGMLKVPKKMQATVKAFNFILGSLDTTNISCAVLGYQDQVSISFSRLIKETDVERRFFRFLINHGIPVLVKKYQEV